MNCEIITIGDELLIGQVIDTNSSWMAQKLNEAGIRVRQMTSVSDDENHIIKAIDDARKYSDIVLMTGGLGPTRDDLTKATLCRYFNSTLIEDPRVLHDLETYFESKGRKLTPINRLQAEVPQKCTSIYNKNGTAPGMWFEDAGQIFVSMPGVPYEMKAMMEEFVLPKLSHLFKLPKVYHFTILTVGVGESFLAERLQEWETGLPKHIKLAYLPSIGSVRLRLSCYQSDADREKEVVREAEVACKLIGKYLFSKGVDAAEVVIGKMLKERSETLSIAESCTGGYLSHLITSVPGASSYYVGSSISYDNDVKSQFLGVDSQVIQEKGAVSEEVAIAMAEGVKKKLATTWALSTTGVAGPGGGSIQKPVGSVWIGLAGPGGVRAKLFHFGNNRFRNIQNASLFAFNMLRKAMVNEPD